MGKHYIFRNNDGIYFITCTLVAWVDLFTRIEYKECVVDALLYANVHKGLQIHAYVIMTNHIHLIISTEGSHDLSAIIRDFKKFTAKKCLQLVNCISESRRVWLMNRFAYEAKRKIRGDKHKFWQEGYHAVELNGNLMIDQRLNYIHQNPVRAGIVFEPHHYVYSSAIDYAGGVGRVPISLAL